MKFDLFLSFVLKLMGLENFFIFFFNHLKLWESLAIKGIIPFSFIFLLLLVVNSNFFKNVMLLLSLFWIGFRRVFYFDIKIVAHVGILTFIHINYLLRLYFWNTNVLVAFFASESINMNPNDHHQYPKCYPNFAITVASLFLSFSIKYRLLKFKTLFSIFMEWLSLFLLSCVFLVLVLGLRYLNEAFKRPFTILAILLPFENIVLMLEQFQFLENSLLLDSLSLSKVFDISSVF